MRNDRLLRRLLVLLLAITLCASSVTVAFASTVTESKTYVLHYQMDGNGYTGKPYQYVSSYIPSYKYDGVESYIATMLFSLYNTQNGQVIPTYCTDIKTPANYNNIYKCINLEDSTYAHTSAGKIRAIMETGFYLNPIDDESDSAHQSRVNAKLNELGTAANVPDLTIGEAITATQTAIWKLSHGSIMEFPDFYNKLYKYNEYRYQTKYASMCGYEFLYGYIKYTDGSYGRVTLDSENKAYIAGRIETVYNYLLSLDPVGAPSPIVSPASFIDLNVPVLTKIDKNNYTVSVTTSVYVNMVDGDALTLTATLDGVNTQPSVTLEDGTNNVTLTFTNVPENAYKNQVKLSISGFQYAEGYFLFTANGGREASQSMVGYSNSRMPVYAEVVAEDSRILNINKTTSNFTPISDIIFDIYPAKNHETYPDAKDNPLKDNLATYTLITDANGQATLNLTHHGLSDGVYLLVERENSKVKAPLDPFYVSIPGENSNEVTVYAKNELVGTPDVTPKGSIPMTKVDADDRTTPLPGAKFDVYRVAQQNETASGVEIPGINGKAIKVTSVTSDENGSIVISDLDYGTYYLVETKAPHGYNLMNSPLEFTIDGNSQNQNPIPIYNRKGSLLPETGGMGTTAFTTTGGALVLLACLFLYTRKRKSV